MSTELASSNPFRRTRSTSSSTGRPVRTASPPPLFRSQENRHPDIEIYTQIQTPTDTVKRASKKVRVQSPPLSPAIQNPLSTIGSELEHKSSNESKLETLNNDDDPFGEEESNASDEAVTSPAHRQAPPNPFQKTLATMETSGRETSGHSTQHTGLFSPGRASLDVDAFKRLLMTGNAGMTSSPALTPPPAHSFHIGAGDGGSSSTDASSISRQSMFEPIQESHAETPRSSHEISEHEDERNTNTATTSTPERKRPPPPNSRHGKLIKDLKVDLKDDLNQNIGSTSPDFVTTRRPPIPSLPSNPSLTDLNKPLPPAPTRESHEMDRESIFDTESAGKIPEPPSPTASLRRKTPPPPPMTRRQSQMVSDSSLVDFSKISHRLDEEGAVKVGLDSGRPKSDSNKAPPPPPSRRLGSVRRPPQRPVATSSSSSTSQSTPPPPPTRGSSRLSTFGRPASIYSIEAPSINKRNSMAPPPPPSRHQRNSFDSSTPPQIPVPAHIGHLDSSRPALEDTRKSSASSISTTPRPEDIVTETPLFESRDVLADLTKLQREIDALRIQAEKSDIT